MRISLLSDAEAKAALIGIRMLSGHGHVKIVIELDCTNAAKVLLTDLSSGHHMRKQDAADEFR